MKKMAKSSYFWLFLGLVTVVVAVPILVKGSPGQIKEGTYVPGELIIKLVDGEQMENSYSVATGDNVGIASIDRLNSKYAVNKMEKLAPLEEGEIYQISHGEKPALKINSVFKIEYTSGHNINEVIEDFAANPQIEYAEPNYLLSADATPDDSLYDEQWALHNTGQTVGVYAGGTVDADIDGPAAWEVETGSNTVKVAVFDSGVYSAHEDLSGNMTSGWNFYDDNNDADDIQGHGTRCAGVIGAVGDNGKGIAGVNWDVKLVPIRITRPDHYSTTSMFISAIDYVIDEEIPIVNYSYGSMRDSHSGESDAITDAKDAGVLLIISAGNDTNDNDGVNSYYPCNYTQDNVICVANTDQNDQLHASSSYGVTSVDLAAPGSVLHTTTKAGGYTLVWGTSYSAPYTAGVAALLKANNSNYSYLGLRNSILDNVDAKASLDGYVVTGGRLNAAEALGDVDSVSPTATITYSETAITNQDVVATLVPSETVTVTNNDGDTTYTFTENGTFTFQFQDPTGNPGTATATVDYIDQDDPEAPTTYYLYSNDSKKVRLDLPPDYSFSSRQPHFEWTGASDEGTGIAGYWVNLATDYSDDALDGEFQTGTTFTAPELTADGTYYLLVVAEDYAGNQSPEVYFEADIVMSFIVTGVKSGGSPMVNVFDSSGRMLSTFYVYDQTFIGGVNVAVGDVDGDGVEEIVVAPGVGGGPHVRIFDLQGNSKGLDFFAYDTGFRGGVNVAVGDVDGGKAEIITAPMSSGGPNVRIFGYRSGEIKATTENFMAYDENFRGGVAVSVGDLDGGKGEIITTPISRGGPHIRVFGYRNGVFRPVVLGIMAYDEAFRGGINSTTGDVKGNGVDEIITGIVKSGGPHVRIFGRINRVVDLINPGFMAYDEAFRGGITVASCDLTYNGKDEIITGVGGDGTALIRMFDQFGVVEKPEFYAYDTSFLGGVTLACSDYR